MNKPIPIILYPGFAKKLKELRPDLYNSLERTRGIKIDEKL